MSDERSAELSRQKAIPWQRGKFYAAYETLVAEYIVRSALEHAKPPTLLDLACGNGMLTGMMAERFPFERIVAVDASEPIIAEARAAYPNFEFVHGMAEDIDEPGAFTTITMLNLLEHVMNPVDLLRSVSRNLADEGVLIVNVPNAMAANRRISKMMGSLTDEHELSPFDLDVAGHRRYYDMDLLKQHVTEAGLDIVTTGGVFYKILSQAQMNWLLEQKQWDEGVFGWGRVGAEKAKDWRKAFCDACYAYGKERPEECNMINIVAKRPAK